ncbi:MAG: hypothetical protein M1817_005403 [Caeruleum heppii]|nr:MAG: hypothetical protein M1817_005403 [Caeruleum heppii]
MAVKGHCDSLASPSYANFALSLFILIGILVSYLPQHYRIIRRRSSLGISPYFVLLGTTSGTCAFANILVLPRSRMNVRCCSQISGFDCFAGLLGIAQVAMQWSCFTVILLLFLIFFPRAEPLAPPKPPGSRPTYRTALLVTLLCIFHALTTFAISVALLLFRPKALPTFANVLGILATVLASIQYFPQLYTTYRLKAVGSLSIPMMLIQTPGSFLWAGSLAARQGTEGWSAWVVYLVTGCLQGTLLIMGIYYELLSWRQRRRVELGRDGGSEQGRRANGAAANHSDERAPLIGNEQ